MLEQLTAMNAAGIKEMRTDRMPTLVPIQEKDWDTMVRLLQAAVDFQPRVFTEIKTLTTAEQMAELQHRQEELIRGYCNSHLRILKESMDEKLDESKKILSEMKATEEQAGKNLERIMSDTMARGRALEDAIAKATEQTDRRKWLIRTAISVGASVLSAVLSTLLCTQWLG